MTDGGPMERSAELPDVVYIKDGDEIICLVPFELDLESFGLSNDR